MGGDVNGNSSYRVGLVVPSSNVTMETEIPALLRAYEAATGVTFTFHGARMRMKTVTAESLLAMDKEGASCLGPGSPSARSRRRSAAGRDRRVGFRSADR